MKAVVQLEPTGCGIASAAAIAGLSYRKAKAIADSLGIHAGDETLWSDTAHVRRLLRRLGFAPAASERPFRSWSGRAYWHWVVFVRESDRAYVLDSRKGLRRNLRTDFGRMKPKWFIAVRAA